MIEGARSWLSPRGHRLAWQVDHCTVDGVLGWAHHRSGIQEIRVHVDGKLLGHATLGLPRPDVAAGLGDVGRWPDAGYGFVFPAGTFSEAGSTATVRLDFVAGNGSTASAVRTFFARRIGRAEMAGACGPDQVELAPLPCDVVRALQELHPDGFRPEALWSEELVDRAVADLANVIELRLPIRPVTSYVLYLRSMASMFGFIAEQFDRFNRLSSAGLKDSSAVATSVDEMLCIANHLYVLRSYGLEGNLVECGCFKGFSTSCLSQACAVLGVRFDVFDSFAGLPSSASEYYDEGDFSGPIEEVEDNILTFGRRHVVELHPGFFSDTIRGYREAVLCLWMDVDLASSAADVMQLLPRLPRESCVFTHECPAECFRDGRPVRECSEVLPPIIDAFAADGRAIAGRCVTGALGALHDPARGLPALDLDRISKLVQSAG